MPRETEDSFSFRLSQSLNKKKECFNPSCRNKPRPNSNFCCEECRIHFWCLTHPRKSPREIEEIAIRKAKQKLRAGA